MLFLVVSFISGIVAVQVLPVLPDIAWLIGWVFLLPIFIYFNHWKMLFFVIGILWAVVFANIRLAHRLPSSLEGQNLLIEGKVVGLPKYDAHRVRFDFSIVKSEQALPKSIRLSWYSSKQLIKSGQHWRMTVKLKKTTRTIKPWRV